MGLSRCRQFSSPPARGEAPTGLAAVLAPARGIRVPLLSLSAYIVQLVVVVVVVCLLWAPRAALAPVPVPMLLLLHMLLRLQRIAVVRWTAFAALLCGQRLAEAVASHEVHCVIGSGTKGCSRKPGLAGGTPAYLHDEIVMSSRLLLQCYVVGAPLRATRAKVALQHLKLKQRIPCSTRKFAREIANKQIGLIRLFWGAATQTRAPS